MESTSTPNEPRAAENAQSFSGDYWNGINPLYTTPSDQPFGIGWDHPVFRGSQPPQEDQSLYPQPPQTWQQQPPMQSTMAAEPQNFGITPQFSVQHPFPQGHAHFDTQPSNTPPYQPYAFEPQAYYPNPGIHPEGGFNQSGAPVLQRNIDQQHTIAPNALQSPMPSFNSPAGVHTNVQVCIVDSDLFMTQWLINQNREAL